MERYISGDRVRTTWSAALPPQGILLPDLTLKVVGWDLLKEANSFTDSLQKEINRSLQMDTSNFILFALMGSGY